MKRFFCSPTWLTWQARLTGASFGLLTAFEDINFNGILANILTLLVTLIASVLFGGDTSAFTG